MDLDTLHAEVVKGNTQIKELKRRLYGEEWDEGDIPELKRVVGEINGACQTNTKDISLLKFKTRYIIYAVLAIASAILGSGGGGEIVENLRALIP